jgi:hypothetical protein
MDGSLRGLFSASAKSEVGENFRKSELLLASSQANFMALNSDAKKWVPAFSSTPHIRPDFP